MYLAQNLNHLVAKNGYKKSHLAKVLNISSSQVRNYLSGESYPRVEGVIEIARLFDVNIDDLLLKDLSQEAGRPFGAEGEDAANTDETLVRMTELLEQRLRIVEQQLKKSDPDAARFLGIE